MLNLLKVKNTPAELNTSSVFLCDDNKVIQFISYQEVIEICEILTKFLSKNIRDSNICIGLLMSHNVYIPSIILSLRKLKHAFIFISLRSFDERSIHLNCGWILSLEDTDKVTSFREVDRLILDDKNLLLWNRNNSFPENTNFQNIFCMVETSGTTGKNKLIRVTEPCIMTNVCSLRKLFDIGSGDIIFWGTSLSFDPSLIELMVALQSGASLVIVPNKVLLNPSALHKALFKIGNVTFLQMVPSLFMRWNVDQIKHILLHSQLRILALGGEHFPGSILSYQRRNTLRVFNLYGVSEISCWATLHEITNECENDKIPVGQNLDETVVELRDEFGNVVQEGHGEIFIGSSSRICYVGDESPKEISGTVFRETGDIAEAKEKRVFLLGRKNKIIKRFGLKVNLTKMEETVFKSTGLENACVWSQQNKKILTFVLVKKLDLGIKDKILDKLRIKLINVLPEEYLPDFVDIVTNFPLTCHGKVNERALENLYSATKITQSYENTFKLLWCKYVGISTEDFDEFKRYKYLEIGGNSLSVLLLLNELKDITKYDYPQELVAMIFENSGEDCIKYLENFEEPLKIESNYSASECSSKIKKTNTCNNSLSILWSHDLKACIDSSPLVFQSEDRVYIAVGSFSHKFIVFQEDGQVIYETTLPDSIESTPSISPCRNYILIGCFNGVMYCVDFLKKKLAWEFSTCDKIKTSGCFIANQSAVVFGSYDKSIYCVSLMKGSKLWSTALDGCISANPVYSNDKNGIYACTTKGTCFCLKDNGQIIWKSTCSGPIFGTPCLVNFDEQIIIPTVQGIMHCLQMETGQLLWKYQAGGHIFSSLVPYKSWILFGCHNRSINALKISVSDCTLSKQLLVESEISSTPFVCSSTDENAVIVTACNSGMIIVIDFNTFEVLSEIKLPGEIFSSPVLYNNEIYVGCRDNNFYCIALNKRVAY